MDSLSFDFLEDKTNKQKTVSQLGLHLKKTQKLEILGSKSMF